MLFFTGINEEGELREFGCALESTEEEFDFLNALIVDGYTLVTAYLLNVEGRINLPVEAFDGSPLSTSLRALQDEWESVLSEPAPENLMHRQELIDLTHRRIDRHQLGMTGREAMIDCLEHWLEIAWKMDVTPRRDRLLCQYERMIATHQAYLKEGQSRLALLDQRLRELAVQ